MKYTEKQLNEYLQEYIHSNYEAIKERLKFLLEQYEDEDRLIPTAVWYCFEEARHTFMMGDYVASIIMCAVTVERHLAKLLELPYHAPTDEESAQTAIGKRLINIAPKKKIIDKELQEKLLQLNKMRSDFVHGLDSSVHKRPQSKDPITNTFMWTEPTVMINEIETKAKRALEILFETEKKLHYSRLDYY